MKPWASGPIELKNHAIEHLGKGSPFDLRIALISVDNSVELAIRTYLGLPKRSRAAPGPTRQELENVKSSFPGLLDLFERYAQQHLDGIELGDIEWYHRIRNQLYHEGNGITVDKQQVDAYYQIAKILIENLFGDEEVEEPIRAIDDSATKLGLFVQKWALIEMELRSKAKQFLPKDKHRTGPLAAIIDALYTKGIDLRDIRKDVAALSQIRNNIVHTGSGSDEILEGSIKKVDMILKRLKEVA